MGRAHISTTHSAENRYPHLLCSLVERLALRRERVRAVDEVVDLLAALQYRFNRLVL